MDGMGSVPAASAPVHAPQVQLPSDCYHSNQAALAMGAAAAGQLDFGDTAPVYTSDGLFLPTKVCEVLPCACRSWGAGCSRVVPAACPDCSPLAPPVHTWACSRPGVVAAKQLWGARSVKESLLRGLSC